MVELGQMAFGNKWESCEAPRFIDNDLYALSEALGQRDPENQSHGLLGGEWGYGQDFENDVFEMHPYWWGDCECGFEEADWAWSEENKHADDCYQSELERRGGYEACEALAAEWGLPSMGCAVHCTCTHNQEYAAWRETHDHQPTCPVVRPNFRHKASDLAVHWYKYIGRSMTTNREITRREWRSIIAECEDSLDTPNFPSDPSQSDAFGAGDRVFSTHDSQEGRG